jgi:2-dehydro-3-deoxygluconokinase
MKSIVTLGEIMLRLKSPQYERLLQSPILEATFGGGEANVAVSLARFGLNAAFVTVLPKNPLGEACLGELRRHHVETSLIVRGGERLGIYFLETGTNQRPSLVVYDRSNSSLATADPGIFAWQDIFAHADWFHLSGITPALSLSAAEVSLQAVQAAKAMGLTISCDYNYRGKLWNYGKHAPEVMRELVQYVDVGIANEEDCQLALGIRVTADSTDDKLAVPYYEELARNVCEQFPNLRMQVITLRESFSANHNDWSACLYNGHDFLVSQKYALTNIVDRVGAGDAFAAAFIYGMQNEYPDQEALNFAVAASALKHTIPGDYNLVSVQEVQNLVRGNVNGRVQR